MKLLLRTSVFLLLIGCAGALLAYQYDGLEIRRRLRLGSAEDFANAGEKTEFAFARLRFNTGSGGYTRFPGRWNSDWPRADRHLTRGIRRLTRVNTRLIEQVVDIENDEMFNWPWVYVEHAESWTVSADEAARLRRYLDRGGFILFDDIHGSAQWQSFLHGLRMVLPDSEIEDLSSDDQIFHLLYDLSERPQIPATRFLWEGWKYPPGATTPHWMGVRDDKGRLVVAMFLNSDVGDAWEWADAPDYPEKYTSFAYRIMINYIIYAMTH